MNNYMFKTHDDEWIKTINFPFTTKNDDEEEEEVEETKPQHTI